MKETNFVKVNQIEIKKQYKLLTIKVPKQEYYEMRLDAMKKEIPVPEIGTQIFLLGWKLYQQEKKSEQM